MSELPADRPPVILPGPSWQLCSVPSTGTWVFSPRGPSRIPASPGTADAFLWRDPRRGLRGWAAVVLPGPGHGAVGGGGVRGVGQRARCGRGPDSAVHLLPGNLLSSLMGSSEQEGEDSQDDSSPIELD